MVRYTVQPGDTLWGISNYFGVSVNDIARYNGIPDLDEIFVGDVIRIPIQSGTVNRWYVVRPGDTLYSISGRFNIPLEYILEMNEISNPHVIYPGQIIQLR